MISAFVAKKNNQPRIHECSLKKNQIVTQITYNQNMISAFVAKKNNQPRIHECSLIKIQIATQIIYNPKYD
jgi:hypothetical protein